MKAKANSQETFLVAIDDGYAQTKVYGDSPEGKGVIRNVFRTSVRSGRYGLRSIGGEGAIDSYKTEEGDEFTVSEQIEAENTQFDGFHVSTMNRTLVHHGLVAAGYGGKPVNLITGLPVRDYFGAQGINEERIDEKRRNLLKGVERVSSGDPLATVQSIDVGCQAVAAWFDHVFDDNLQMRAQAKGRFAIVDVGGRTTDIAVVVNGKSVDDSLSGTRNVGVLDVYKALEAGLHGKFKIRDSFPLADLDAAVRTGRIDLWGKSEDISDLVTAARQDVESQIQREIDRKIGGAMATLSAIIFVGGGSALYKTIATRFPNGVMPEDPEFANARGLYKFAKLRAQAGDKAA